MDVFETICGIVLGHEGGFTAVSTDPGNWTGGAVGVGRLVGTKWGISAASFPTLDIAALTQEQAAAIYRALYWVRVRGDALPAPLALLVFDAAVNNGVGRASQWLQAAVSTTPDGLLGSETMAALATTLARPDGLLSAMSEFMAQRTMFMAALPTWRTFGLGWARRLCRLPLQAATLSQAPSNGALNPLSDAA